MTSVIALTLIVSYAVLIGDTPIITSFGAPPSSSGAPGEKTCMQSGCHDDGPVNYSKAQLTIQIAGNPSVIIPGNVYDITITIADSLFNRFGFQLVALDESKNQCGTFIIEDSMNTQVMMNFNELKDREYLTYTNQGTFPKQQGYHSWKCKWKAPEKTGNTVAFYSAAISANADNTDKGDYTSFANVSLPISQAMKAQEYDQQNHVTVKRFNSYFQLESTELINKITITNMNSKVFFTKEILGSDIIINQQDFPAGLYIITIEIDNHILSLPLLLN